MRISLTAFSIAAALVLASCTSGPAAQPPSVTMEAAPPSVPQVQPAPPAPPVPVASAPSEAPAASSPFNAEWLRPVSYDVLPGWDKDDLREAWPAFIKSCSVLMKRVEWSSVCSLARTVNATEVQAVRRFFEEHMVPHRVVNPDGSSSGMVTGYYEPLLRGARKRGGAYQVPLHGVPDDMLTIDLGNTYPELKGLRLRGRLEGKKIVPYYSREDLARSKVLAGKELLWVDDPIEAFFLQVQGSGRIWLSDTKEMVRAAYADQNGHPYKSIGRYLVDKGELALHQASAQGIKAWAAANPARLHELLNANPSYIFFRLEKILDPKEGPKGAMGIPLTAQRSIAIDPLFIPLGAPVYLATTQPNSDALLQRLVLAQDTGSAIKNAVRADYFWGTGAQAGELAGRMKQRGMMWVLLPKAAHARNGAS